MNKIHEAEYDGLNNFHIIKQNDELHVTLTYPNIASLDQCTYIVVDQESARASDGLRIHYDYKKDGYVIEQPTDLNNNKWKEVGFFKAWAEEYD